MAEFDLTRVVKIAPSEYRDRQQRARELAEARGLDGVVAFSRGGSTQDRYADAYYLTGFYTHFPTLHDYPGRWRAAGHCACVVSPNAVALIHDVRQLRDDAPVADEVTSTADVIAGLADALRRHLPDGGHIAVLGGEQLAGRWQRWLAAELPRHDFVEADELGHQLRLIKSTAEAGLLRAAGEVGGAAVEAAMEAAVPGASEADVARAAIEQIVAAGGAFYGLGLSSGRWAHTFSPTRPAAYDGRQRIAVGDMVRLDLYGSIEGYLFDLGRSTVAGAKPTAVQQAILSATIDSVQAGLDSVRPGVSLDEVARRCDDALAGSAYASHFVVGDSPLGTWGHSLGLCWEPPWIERGKDLLLQPGMCLAVELRIEQPAYGGANFEENILVNDEGYELLSQARIPVGGNSLF
jgi:Xaa-Pro aminopeptidase